MRWFDAEFPFDLRRSMVVLPTPDFFPGSYHGSEEDVRKALDRVCRYMSVDPARVVLEYVEEADGSDLLSHLPSYTSTFRGAAGHYRRQGDRCVISINGAEAREPMALIATMAHELAHQRLLGEHRISPDRPDQEPLTDLLTVYLGMGIFTANAAFDFSAHGQGWRAQRLGYLTEPMFGYALALYAWRRGETVPSWMRHLDTNPRAYLKKGLRYLTDRASRRQN